ncbi:gas vesicle protein [Streptomyces sp. NPDC094472]|uniref:gas vesicle protein n=1 Tax=unclassified Streptomyces TaxID=2593676 RepID=UPI003324AA83
MARAIERREVALVDLLDRVLAGGVVIAGEITLTIADIDLVRISPRALIASVVESEEEERGGREGVRHDG